MAVNNVSEISDYIKSKFKELCGDDVSDYELNMIGNSIGLAYRTVPTSKSQLGDMIAEAVRSKSDIQYLINKIRDKRKVISINYTSEYNKQFTILTRQGRPSKAAIDAEIHYLYKNMYEDSLKIQSHDELIQFMTDQLSILDMIIRNMESRRYDL